SWQDRQQVSTRCRILPTVSIMGGLIVVMTTHEEQFKIPFLFMASRLPYRRESAMTLIHGWTHVPGRTDDFGGYGGHYENNLCQNFQQMHNSMASGRLNRVCAVAENWLEFVRQAV